MKTNLKSTISSVLLVVLFIALGYGLKSAVVWHHNEQIKKSATAYVQAANAGDTNKAYTLLSLSAQSKQTKTQAADALYGLKSDKATLSNAKLYVGSDRAIYTVTVSNLPTKVNGRTTADLTLSLTPVRFGWKIDSLTVN